jgi:membrane fusion protein, multidrug efflux system
MNRILILIAVTFTFIACGSGNKQAQLKELEAKRDALNAEINTLRTELALENANNMEEIKKVVDVKQINTAEFRHFIKIQGTVESDNNILIPAQTSGIVKRIHVREGQQVKKGQLLAELDGAVYERTIAELKTNLELATTIFERQQRLWNKNIGSEVQYLQAKTNKESLEQRLASTNEQYQFTKITAPISGSVDQILIKENEAAAAGFGTIRIVKPSELKITANLSEVYQESIKKGDSVMVHVPMLNTSFMVTISSVSQVIDPKNRTFIVEIKLPKGHNDLKPNMLVKLSINDYTNPSAITVPLNTIQKTGEKAFLFTAKKSVDSNEDFWLVSKRFVQPGTYQENTLEITNGLDDGEFIVVTGFQDLADGQKVRLAKSQPVAANN